jgi:hypothetical protein
MDVSPGGVDLLRLRRLRLRLRGWKMETAGGGLNWGRDGVLIRLQRIYNF